MKTTIFDIGGKKSKDIQTRLFEKPIREDMVWKFLETRKRQQPHGPSPVAGKQYSARGKIRHRRHVWKSQYGRGISRVPRKMFMVRGSQFNWEGAAVPQARGGMRAHPPKVLSMINILKINKKESKKAFSSAISATGNEEKIRKRYDSLDDKTKINAPVIIESKLSSLKTKELISGLKKILGENLFNIALPDRKIRSGKGKSRGRKYRKSAGLLIVIGNDENLKTNAFEVKKVKNLNVNDLARGGLGRLTVYTENAIKELEERFK